MQWNQLIEKPVHSIRSYFCLFLFFVIIPLFFASCGIHYSVEGQVVDSQTSKPIEGAVVAINWQRTKIGIPGLPIPRERYGTWESVTDSNGNFTVPKYLIGHHYMGVYKPGYICWSSETIFNPKGKNWKEMFEPRYGHTVKSGMIVKLNPKSIDFPKVKHARFIMDVGTALAPLKPKFNNAVAEAREIYIDFIDSKKREGIN